MSILTIQQISDSLHATMNTSEVPAKRLRPSCSASPVDKFIYDQECYFSFGHFDSSYPEWRMHRIKKMISILGIDFKGWRILELGGGHGEIGAFFAELGAEVVSAEGRLDNRNFANLKFRNIKNFKSVEFDGEKDFSFLGKFDLIINFGFIEVVENINNVLDCCSRMSNRIILDTLVCDSMDPECVLTFTYDEIEYDDHPLHGRNCKRPSPAYIENFFAKAGFKCERHFTEDLNIDYFDYTWEHFNNMRTEVPTSVGITFLRRFWLFTS